MYICYTDKYVYSLYETSCFWMSNTDTEAQDKKIYYIII